jgi:hypothetical protein
MKAQGPRAIKKLSGLSTEDPEDPEDLEDLGPSSLAF